MRKQLMLWLCLALAMPLFSQTSKVKGILSDTSEKKNLYRSVVSLLKEKDSTFVIFTRSNQDGSFELSNVKPGKYILFITHPTYADFYKVINLTAAEDLNLAKIPMTTASQLLQEVVVRQKLGAIRIKKDTTEFIADSFKVGANASVEDLLKRLPGVQVDKDGKIKAQGEDIGKVYVDGEEFFGDDPTMATKNLRADAVEKVQVFDKKSDQATFTGIDDGQTTKAINLQLKEDKKNGYFGKVNIAGGLKDKFSNEGMINAFKGKRKFAAFGIMSNTGKTGLNWEDQNNFGGGDNSNMEIDAEAGMVMIFSEGDDFGGGGGSYYGEGLPTSWSAGMHYNNKWNGDKLKFNSSFRFNKLNTSGSGFTRSQFLLKDTSYYKNDNGNNFSTRFQNSMNLTYEYQIDSTSSLKFTAKGAAGQSQKKSYIYSESLSEELNPVNQSYRTTTSKGEEQMFNSTLLYKKRFKKKGRTISWNNDFKYTNTSSDGFLNSANFIYFNNTSIKDSIDQEKINNSKKTNFNSKLVYTEPLAKKIFLELSYSIGVNNSNSERITNEKINGKYEDYIDSLSSHFQYDILTQAAGSSLKFNYKKVNFSFGGSVSNARFKQADLVKDTLYRYNFTNFFPRAGINLNFKPMQRFGMNYSGSTRQPTIDQIQPILDNTDPFLVRKGNPNLKQSFTHSFSFNFSDFKVLNNRGIWLFANFNFTDNAFSTKDDLDATGKRTSQAININGNYYYNLYSSYGFKIKKTDFNINFDLQLNGSRNKTIVNNAINSNVYNSTGLGVGTNYHKDKKFDMNLSVRQNYNSSTSSLSTVKNNFWSTSIDGSATLQLPKKFELNTNIDFTIRQKTALFNTNRNIFLMRGYVGKKVFKGETGLVKFEMRDIFNQNIGYDRSINSNTITERGYQQLQRLWLLSFTWNFNHSAAAKKTEK